MAKTNKKAGMVLLMGFFIIIALKYLMGNVIFSYVKEWIL